MEITIKIKFILISLLLFLGTGNVNASKIIVASTSSTYDTGLLNLLNDKFYKKFNISVQVLSLGTGQAIRTAKDGNAEILLVHHKPSEIEFMNDGYGIERHEIMYNDYILVGPKNDNDLCKSVQQKLEQIYINQFLFISRGDDSGTHRKELEMWDLTNIEVNKNKQWYLSVGQGMGSTLLIANEKQGYDPKAGAALLAARTGSPILPVAIINSHRAFPKGSLLPRLVSIHLRVGELIQPPQTKKREDLISTTKEIQISINSMLDEGLIQNTCN